MKIIVWYVMESKTLRYIIAENIQITRRNNIDLIELPNGASSVISSGRIRTNARTEDVLIELCLAGVGEVVLLREAGIDRIAFIYDDFELDRVFTEVPELRTIGLENKDIDPVEPTPQKSSSPIEH
ncbi:hypothetical protein [Thermococcus sibiricus]|nr:hypothetical protein [Thermococcus sibiricus]